MADKNAKAEQNVAGRYYVDTSCIMCGQCIEIAPSFFAEGKYGVYVQTQPGSDEGEELCERALTQCPVGAIGSDGQ